MTPKEKAQKLVSNFEYQNNYGISENTGLKGIDKKLAKQCALIAVDEIIQSICNFGYTNTIYDDFETNKMTLADEKYPTAYWEQVKQEIEKL